MNTTTRFIYSVRTAEQSCCCVCNDVLRLIALETQGELSGACVIRSHIRISAKAIKALETEFKVTIALSDTVVSHANWLLAVAKSYPDATIEQLAAYTSEREFAALLPRA